MRRLTFLILALTAVLVTVVTGCGGAARYDSRLVQADSLMATDPDSALAVLEVLPVDSLTAPGDRAYHGLLVSQARYKAYVTATTDSDINRALAYYRAHSGEREKLTRAYIYKGAVMEELGHPDSAMYYYKSAEATAAPDDYFNLGYINLRIAELYQSSFNNDTAVVTRMRNAYGYFEVLCDTDYMITALGTQGLFPGIVGKDSSRYFLNTAIELAQEFNSIERFQFQSKLSAMYFFDNDYRRSIDYAMQIINEGGDANESLFYYCAARSYVQLSKMDSALWVLSITPKPTTAVDSMNYYLLLADLSKATNRIHDYSNYLNKAEFLHSRILETSLKSELDSIESTYDANYQAIELKNWSKVRIILISLISLILMIAIITLAVFYIRKKTCYYEEELNNTKQELERMINDSGKKIFELLMERDQQESLLTEKNHKLSHLTRQVKELEGRDKDIRSQVSTIVRYRNSALKELYNEIRVKSLHGNKKISVPLISIVKELNDKKQILKLKPKKSFWEKLKLSVDGEFHGIASFILNEYPTLSHKDFHFFLLTCANISPQIIKLYMDYTNAVTVSNYKRNFIKDKFGLELKFEEFINLYLQKVSNQ